MSETAATPSINVYKKLPRDEQRILEVLSVVYEPINQTTLKRVVRLLKWQSESGASLSNLVAKPLWDKLLQKQLVIQTGGLLVCNPDIVEVLTQHQVLEGRYKETALAVKKIVPIEQRGHYDFTARYNSDTHKYKQKRYLRDALYSSDINALYQLLNVEDNFQSLDEDEANTLRKMIQHSIGSEWFAQQTEELQLLELGALLKLSGIYLVDSEEYAHFFRLMQKTENQSRSLIHLAVEQKLIRGDFEGVTNWLEGDSSSYGLSLQGWNQHLLGQYDEAIHCYNDALKAKRKETGKRNVYIPGYAGLFFLLSLFQRNTPDDDKLLCAYLKTAPKTMDAVLDDMLPVMALVADAASIARGASSLQASHLFCKHHLDDVEQEFLLYLIHDVALYWLGEKDKIQSTETLVKFCQQTYKNGYLWYAYEYAFLLDKLGKNDACHTILAEANQRAGFKPLVSLRSPVEPWMRALDVLKSIPEQAHDGISGGNPAADLRMVWWLDCENEDQDAYVRLAPREQKRTKQGAWSKGRAVSLRRLFEEFESFDYLSPQDKKICQTIQKSGERGYYGHTDYSYHLLDEEALCAAIGHPLIFWAAEACEWTVKRSKTLMPVEITKGEPELFVTEHNQHVNIEIAPNPAHALSLMDNIVLKQEGTHRLCLIQYSQQHVRIANILGETGLQVPLDAKERALDSIASVAPILTVHSNVEGHSLAATPVEVDQRIHVHLQPVGEGFQMDLYVQPFTDGGPLFKPGQGGVTVFAEVEGKRLQTSRDLKQEAEAVDQLINQCPELPEPLADNEWHVEELEKALEVLVYLQSLGDAVVMSWPQGKKLKLTREMSQDKMNVSIRKKRDWLEINGELKVDQDNTIAMERLLELVDASPGRFIRLDDESILVLTKGLRDRLKDLQSYTDKGRFHLLASPAIEEMTEGMAVKSSKQWKEQLNRFNETQQMNFNVPSTLQAELRDYQVEGFQWLARLAHWGAGACLADDMGLGKTLQSLALILTRAHKGPTLILAPTSVCFNWVEEAARFAPTLKPKLFGGHQRQTMLDNVGAFDLVICSYGLLQSEAERLSTIQWHTIVADEAQAIKNPQAKRTKAAMALNGDFKIITTGTPIENHLGELWSLFRFINPGLLGSLERFNKRFANPIENDDDVTSKQQLRRLTKPFILRRVKSDVLTELPSRTDIAIHVELSKEEAAFYEALRRQALKRMEQPEENQGQKKLRILAELMKLRRACCNPNMVLPDANIASSKLKVFGDIVDELLENRHKALVFSQFVGHLALIREYLDKKQIPYQYLDGSTPAKQRKIAVDAFQAGEGDLFLISLKAGGVGLNLTAADYVIHMDPWWNPAVEDQASDRAHRLGQQRPVTVYRLVTRNTIEDKIVEMHNQKRDLANSLLEGTESTGKMSVEDMMQLIEG